MSVETYSQAVDFLYGRINYESLKSEQFSSRDFKLDRMEKLLELLNNPQLKIPAIHVAGTKGKGTTCAYLASILQAAGMKVGLFTSPHLYRIEERLVINGVLLEEDEFIALVNRLIGILSPVIAADHEMTPTFFEMVCALGWMHFAAAEVDLVVLEVGLGGRLDCTNLCAPLVTVITSISLDHTRLLGSTLAAIATEKAGILKREVPLVCGVESGEAQDAIYQIALQTSVPITQAGINFHSEQVSPWSIDHELQSLVFRSDKMQELSGTYAIRQPADVSRQNAALAIQAIGLLKSSGIEVRPDHIATGLLEARLPLRFEVLKTDPLVIADSAHNPASIRELMRTTQAVLPGRKPILVFAMSRDKDAAAICRELKEIETCVVSQYLGNQRALSAADLAAEIRQHSACKIALAQDPETAVELALEQCLTENEYLLVTGSLFFAAEVRQLFVSTNSDCPTFLQP